MSDWKQDYYLETIEAAAEDFGQPISRELATAIASAVVVSVGNQGMADGSWCIPNPQTTEIKQLQAKLDHERRLIHCRTCNGSGRIITPGPYHSSDSQCWKCNGEGKHLP